MRANQTLFTPNWPALTATTYLVIAWIGIGLATKPLWQPPLSQTWQMLQGAAQDFQNPFFVAPTRRP